mgnify:CR=1 FL=1
MGGFAVCFGGFHVRGTLREDLKLNSLRRTGTAGLLGAISATHSQSSRSQSSRSQSSRSQSARSQPICADTGISILCIVQGGCHDLASLSRSSACLLLVFCFDDFVLRRLCASTTLCFDNFVLRQLCASTTLLVITRVDCSRGELDVCRIPFPRCQVDFRQTKTKHQADVSVPLFLLKSDNSNTLQHYIPVKREEMFALLESLFGSDLTDGDTPPPRVLFGSCENSGVES